MLGTSRKVNRSSIAPDSRLENDTAGGSALSRNVGADPKNPGSGLGLHSKKSLPTLERRGGNSQQSTAFRIEDLERSVRRLKEVLKREGIALPTEEDYTRAAAGWAAEKQSHYKEWIAWANQQADRVDPFVCEKPVSVLDRKHEVTLAAWCVMLETAHRYEGAPSH
jgi:hypothetical protein